MAARLPTSAPPSPLDPFVRRLLAHLATMEEGFLPTQVVNQAPMPEWPPAFTEAIYVSIRARGMVEPFRRPGRRVRNRWQVSMRGSAWLADDEV